MKKLLLLFAILLLASCTSGSPMGGDLVIPDNLKLEAPKSKILLNKIKEECIEYIDSNLPEHLRECKTTKDVARYFYISDKEVEQRTTKHNNTDLVEDVSLRTHNSVTFRSELLGGSNTEFISHLIPGPSSFAFSDGGWFEIDEATTTIENFEKQTATTTIEKIISFFTSVAKADDFEIDAGSGSGRCYAASTVYSTAHNATTGSCGTNPALSVEGSTYFYSPTYYVDRVFWSIDTSGLPDDADISAADLYMYTYDTLGGSYEITIVEGLQASEDEIVAADFNDIGSTELATRNSETTDFSWSNISLNQTGIDHINLTGKTLLATISGKDFDNIGTGLNTTTYGSIYFTGYVVDEDLRPYLKVVYTAGGGGALVDGFSITDF